MIGVTSFVLLHDITTAISPLGEFVFGVHWTWETWENTTTSTSMAGDFYRQDDWGQPGGAVMTTSSTTPAAAGGPGGGEDDFRPDATVADMTERSLQGLVDGQLPGGVNQSGHLLMELHQGPADFTMLHEYAIVRQV